MELILLKTKAFIMKVWSFLKLYGTEILLGAALVYTILLVKQRNDIVESLIKQQKETREAHKKNLEVLQQQVEQEIQRRQSIEREHANIVRQINEQHDATLKEIASLRSKEIRALVEKHHDNPEKMAETINEVFGIPLFKPQN